MMRIRKLGFPVVKQICYIHGNHFRQLNLIEVDYRNILHFT